MQNIIGILETKNSFYEIHKKKKIKILLKITYI
jgi:hypothetical protein